MKIITTNDFGSVNFHFVEVKFHKCFRDSYLTIKLLGLGIKIGFTEGEFCSKTNYDIYV